MNLSVPTNFRLYLTLLVLISAFSNIALGQSARRDVSDIKSGLAQPEAAVISVTLSGNVDCADLNASTNSAFSHIIDNYGLKLDFSTPNGSYAFAPGSQISITGPQYPTRFVTVSSSGSTVHSWNSQVLITAVILKVGNQSVVYPYKPFATRDADLITGIQQSISHLTFCYADATAPTAGDGSVSGRVVDSAGNGISRATVTVVDAATGEASAVRTDSFGNYTIGNLAVGELYLVRVSHKRYVFAEDTRTLTLNDSLADIDFVASQ